MGINSIKVLITLINVNKNVYETSNCIKNINRRIKSVTVICEPNNRTLVHMMNDSMQFFNDYQVTVIISNELKVEQVPLTVNNLIAVKLIGKNVIVIGAYIKHFKPQDRLLQARQYLEMHNLMNIFRNYKFILIGDLNAFNGLWSDTPDYSVPRPKREAGNLLIDLMELHSLKIVNSGKIPTLTGKDTVIDLIVASSTMKVDWSRVQETEYSDHNMVKAYVMLKPTLTRDRIRIFKNWTLETYDWRRQTAGRTWTSKDSIIKKCRDIINFPYKNSVLKDRKLFIVTKDDTSFTEQLKMARDSSRTWQLLKKYVFPGKSRIDFSNDITMESKKNHLSSFSHNKPDYTDEPANIYGDLSREEIKMLLNMKKWSSSLSADQFTSKTWGIFYQRNKHGVLLERCSGSLTYLN